MRPGNTWNQQSGYLLDEAYSRAASSRLTTMAPGIFWLVSVQDDGLTDANRADGARNAKLHKICSALFKESGAVARLRQTAGLGKRDTPKWATAEQFQQYTDNAHGVGAEALALTLWHLAAERHWSGSKCERYRHAAEWAWK